MYTIEILDKKTKQETNYVVNNKLELIHYLFDENEFLYKKKKHIGDCMRDCIDIMKRYPEFLAKVKKI